MLDPEALPLVGRAPGCDLSDPSQVMEPRGPTSHTATAMDPVHGSQSSFGSTDVTLTAQRGAVLLSSCGSESMGEVSMGTASTALTGQRNQPMDAARQPLLVNDSALSGLSAFPGQSFHSAAVHGDTPMEVEMGRAWPAPRPCRTQGAFPFRVSLASPGPSPPSRELGHPRDSPAPLGVRGIFRVGANASHQAGTTPLQGSGNGAGPPGSPALPDQLSISLPGISRLPGAQPSLSGVRPPPGFTSTPMGSGEFSGPGQTPAIRQAPPLHFGGIRPLPNRTTATITSVTAPVETMDSYGGVSTSTSLGRPFPLWA